MLTDSDATPAYRGYRLQALYTLERVLNQQQQSLIFQPEGKEDLAVFDSGNRLVEIVQVKQRGTNLALSSFKPEKENSFFCRVSAELDQNPNTRVRVVAFGEVGPEIHKALLQPGKDRTNVAGKIASHGHLSLAKAIVVLDKAELTPANEAQLTSTVYGILGNSLPGVDPISAFDLLMHWLYICAENKIEIKRSDVIDRISNVGKFLAARSAHHAEWFTSIIPLQDTYTDDLNVSQALAHEFYQGISTRYEHILSDLDVIRSEKLSAISTAFRDKKVVVIHAASGQGKTTLAYRYLHDFFPEPWRFRIASMGSREQALRVAFALTSHADAIGIPLVVYVAPTEPAVALLVEDEERLVAELGELGAPAGAALDGVVGQDLADDVDLLPVVHLVPDRLQHLLEERRVGIRAVHELADVREADVAVLRAPRGSAPGCRGGARRCGRRR